MGTMLFELGLHPGGVQGLPVAVAYPRGNAVHDVPHADVLQGVGVPAEPCDARAAELLQTPRYC